MSSIVEDSIRWDLMKDDVMSMLSDKIDRLEKVMPLLEDVLIEFNERSEDGKTGK